MSRLALTLPDIRSVQADTGAQIAAGETASPAEIPAARVKIEVDSSEEGDNAAAPTKHTPDISGKVPKLSVADACEQIRIAMAGKAAQHSAMKKPAASPASHDHVFKRPAAAAEASDEAEEEVPAKKVKGPAASVKDPHYGIEWSRKQVQCRSGLTGPGQNKALKFTGGDEKEAVALAEQWVRDKRKERGLPPLED